MWEYVDIRRNDNSLMGTNFYHSNIGRGFRCGITEGGILEGQLMQLVTLDIVV